MKNSKLILILSLLTALLLSGCSSGGGGGNKASQISGIVLLPAQQTASRTGGSLWDRSLGIFISKVYADVLGLAPVANATVELVRLDSQGNVISVLNTTTSDAAGAYSFTTTLTPDSTLAVRLPNEPAPTRAIVTSASTDITPATEAVLRTIINEITAPPVSSLANYTVAESQALLDLVNGMNIDVSTAPSFDAAVTQIMSQAGATLTNLAAGYATPASVTALYQNNYAVLGETTTLVPPPQLNGASAGIDHRAVDGALGFNSATGTIKGGNEFGLIVISNLSTASFFCDADSLFADTFIPASNGQVAIRPAAGGGAVVGATSADNKLLVYPLIDNIAGINGSAIGSGRGIRIAMQSQNSQPIQGASLNPSVSGLYNLVWSNNYLANGGGGMGGGMGGGGTYSTAIGTATLNFDSTQTATLTGFTTGVSPMTSTSAFRSTLTADLAAGTISNISGADNLSGVYTVLPGNEILAPLGNTTGMMGGMGGGGDFLQGTRIATATGQPAPLIAFSNWIAGGGMGGGGGMGMGGSGCSGNGGGGGFGSSSMMGGGAGEGRGLTVAALQTTGLGLANISGTYNAVVQLTSFTAGTGTVLLDSEIRHGTMSFDGAGNVTASTLFFHRATMDAAQAIAGTTTAVTATTGTLNYSGTYTVSSLDGTMSLNLTGLTTGTGFSTADGGFLAFPIDMTTTGVSGSRGLLLLVRQP